MSATLDMYSTPTATVRSDSQFGEIKSDTSKLLASVAPPTVPEAVQNGTEANEDDELAELRRLAGQDETSADNFKKNAATQAMKVAGFVERWRGLEKKSVKNLIDLAQTLVEAKRDLSTSAFDDFCKAVGLEGSTARKYEVIGKAAVRFKPFMDQLPNSWTTLYTLAGLETDDFEKVVDSPKFGPCMTAEILDQIVNGSDTDEAASTGETAEPKPSAKSVNLVIDLQGLNTKTMRDVLAKVNQLKSDFGFRTETSARLAKALTPKKKKQKPQMPTLEMLVGG